jgi:hypothetical protein
MPMRIAEKHQWTKQPPYNFYHFPEEHRAGWQNFWESMDGDLDKVLAFAEKSDIECPCEWAESLHRFLFSIFSGDPKLLKNAADKSFGSFLSQVATNHQKEPKEKNWYTIRGITQSNFVAMLERASDIKDARQAVAFINARVRDLGFYLYSEFILSKTKGKSEIKSVASDLNKQAFKIEKKVLGESPLIGIRKGQSVRHSLFPDEHFMVIEAIKNNEDEPEMLITRDTKGRIAFIEDLWNVLIADTGLLQPTDIGAPSPMTDDPDVQALLQIENYDDFINALEAQTQQHPTLINQREHLIQQWQQRHPGTHTVTI